MEKLQRADLSSLHPERSVPLRGFITRDDKDQVWISDRVGTWIVPTEAIVARDDWKAKDARFKGNPEVLFLRDGAVIHEVRKTTIKIEDRPRTISCREQAPERVDATTALEEAERRLSRHLGFEPWSQGGDPLNHDHTCTTVSCWDTGDWGMDCSGDDCG